MVGVHHKLHAGVIDDVLGIDDLGKTSSDFAGAVEKEPVSQLHDVRLVDGVNLLAAKLARIIEGKLRDAGRTLFGDDLQALRDARPEPP